MRKKCTRGNGVCYIPMTASPREGTPRPASQEPPPAGGATAVSDGTGWPAGCARTCDTCAPLGGSPHAARVGSSRVRVGPPTLSPCEGPVCCRGALGLSHFGDAPNRAPRSAPWCKWHSKPRRSRRRNPRGRASWQLGEHARARRPEALAASVGTRPHPPAARAAHLRTSGTQAVPCRAAPPGVGHGWVALEIRGALPPRLWGGEALPASGWCTPAAPLRGPSGEPAASPSSLPARGHCPWS